MKTKLEKHELVVLWTEDGEPTIFNGYEQEMWSGPHDENGFEIHFVLKNKISACCFRLNTKLGVEPNTFLQGESEQAGKASFPEVKMRMHWREEPENLETREIDECPLFDGDPCWIERMPDTDAWMGYSTLIYEGLSELFKFMLEFMEGKEEVNS